MEEYRLNGLRMTSRQEAHAYLKRKMYFPDYYGENLDALWDQLTTLRIPCRIIIRHPEALEAALGDYGDRMLDTFREASRQVPGLELVLED